MLGFSANLEWSLHSWGFPPQHPPWNTFAEENFEGGALEVKTQTFNIFRGGVGGESPNINNTNHHFQIQKIFKGGEVVGKIKPNIPPFNTFAEENF